VPHRSNVENEATSVESAQPDTLILAIRGFFVGEETDAVAKSNAQLGQAARSDSGRLFGAALEKLFHCGRHSTFNASDKCAT
jgi:hypothetical protein